MPNPLQIINQSKHAVAVQDVTAYGPIDVEPRKPGTIARTLQAWATDRAQTVLFKNRLAANLAVKVAQQDALRDEMKTIVIAAAKMHGGQVRANLSAGCASELNRHVNALVAEKQAVTGKLTAKRCEMAMENYITHQDRRNDIMAQLKAGKFTEEDAEHLLEIVGVLKVQAESAVDNTYEAALLVASEAMRVATATAAEMMTSFPPQTRLLP